MTEKKSASPDVSDSEVLKQKSYYSDEALLKMVNLLYDPLTLSFIEETGLKEEAHLLSLTRINSSKEAYFWAVQIAKEAILNNPKRTWPISKIIRVGFLLARRSIDMKAFMLGVGLAQEQALTKGENGVEEDAEW